MDLVIALLISAILGGLVAVIRANESRMRRAFILGMLAGPVVMLAGKYAGDRALGLTASEESLAAVNRENAAAYEQFGTDLINAAVERGRAEAKAILDCDVMDAREQEWNRLMEAAAERQFRLDVLERKRQWVEAAAARAGLK